ncbi:sodium channel protein Nach-like [Aricia agestis]|uniref:sodium channel protein Nach-like n=1 Tax=Aricia agestis TaxID=91739 RepID=UPI001C20689A|nr:sodium channel protein Nach-like [Aricia agestis]
MIWQKYALNPTFTIVETTQWSTEKVAFPALSVCDPQVIYAPNAKNISNILRLRGYNDTEVDQFYRSFSNIKKADYVPPDYIKKMHSTLEDLGYNYNYLTNEMRTPCDMLLRRCEWRSKQFDCSTMFRDVFSVAGHCCQFDLQYFRESAGREVEFTSGIDISEALDIQINVIGDGGNDGLVFMYIFDSQNELTLLDSSITLSAGTFFDVTVDVWVIDSSNDVTALSLRDRQCFLETEGSSYQSCTMQYIMKIVIAVCKCIPFNYAVSPPKLHKESFPPCNWPKLKCVYETLDKTLSDMRHVMSALQCYQKCDYTQYETETELVKRERNMKKVDETYCRVTVHFGDMTCMKYRREVLYSWDQMLANLGGIFGLCLGGSIVSVIEVLWLLADMLYTALTYKNISVSVQNPKLKPKENADRKLKYHEHLPYID